MDDSPFVAAGSLPAFALWHKVADRRVPLSFELELTARCNNNCRHCYINLPATDPQARRTELAPAEIGDLADQAVALGALWCVFTGGEPLLRTDFAEIYLALKRKGLLLSLFTNACLIGEEQVALLKRYPPREVEVTVYGATRETYEQVTRLPGSYAAFRQGLDRLLDGGIKVRLKAMALRSNAHELPAIAAFCRRHTLDYYRFDPLLHLRLDGDPTRNREIAAERLSPAEIVALEEADGERKQALAQACDRLLQAAGCREGEGCNHLFHCGAGQASFSVAYDGTFRLCASLCAPGTTADLRRVRLAQAWQALVPQVRALRSDRPAFLATCRACQLVNLCLHCPALAQLESGALDGDTPYFCAVAHARADMLGAWQAAGQAGAA